MFDRMDLVYGEVQLPRSVYLCNFLTFFVIYRVVEKKIKKTYYRYNAVSKHDKNIFVQCFVH